MRNTDDNKYDNNKYLTLYNCACIYIYILPCSDSCHTTVPIHAKLRARNRVFNIKDGIAASFELLIATFTTSL